MYKKEQKFFDEILDNMFQAVGFKGFDHEFVKHDGWYRNRTWTTDQQENFKKCFIAKAKKDLGWNKKKAELEWGYFNLNYGWRIKDA